MQILLLLMVQLLPSRLVHSFRIEWTSNYVSMEGMHYPVGSKVRMHGDGCRGKESLPLQLYSSETDIKSVGFVNSDCPKSFNEWNYSLADGIILDIRKVRVPEPKVWFVSCLGQHSVCGCFPTSRNLEARRPASASNVAFLHRNK